VDTYLPAAPARLVGDGGFRQEGRALPVLRFVANRAHPAKSMNGFSRRGVRHIGCRAVPRRHETTRRPFSSMQSSILNQLAAAAPAGAPPAWIQYLPFVAMAVIFWFLILRPQMKQQKEHKNKLSALKKGDEVLTGGGLVGKIVKIDDNYADIQLAQGVVVKAVKSTIVDVIPPAGSKPAND
jgi:preprotein translocase subunit YajC